MAESSPIIIYQTEDGRSRIECKFEGETIWLSQALMAELFERSKKTISEHLANLFEEGEIEEDSVVRKYRTTAADGKDYEVLHYNLQAIIAVAFRIKSPRAMQFRRWANTQLQELLKKGFVMDDERLKNPDASPYFEELLGRIRDIRSSEKVFWRKICDIYATSIDYDGQSETAQTFFAQIQNKMHWAAHGHTAAELIHQRTDADQPAMGLNHYKGKEPRKAEVTVAKNYLNADELDLLNRIVTAYLEFAEMRAQRGLAMTMADWLSKLDDFLKLGDHDLLTHAGKISADQAKDKAHLKYDRYRKVIDVKPTQVDKDLEDAIKRLPKPNNS